MDVSCSCTDATYICHVTEETHSEDDLLIAIVLSTEVGNEIFEARTTFLAVLANANTSGTRTRLVA